MWTPGLKKRLIEKIRRTEDPVVLEEAYRLLEIETEDLDVYKLNDEQKSAVREASLKSFLTYILLLPVILFTSSCSGAGSSPSEIAFVGSTPGDELIKSMLTLHPATMVDFIRWNLTLNDTKPDKNTFILSILFGEAQPNTLGFKGGGEKALFKGEFTVSKNENKNINGEIYHLKSSQLPSGISMVKLNDNLFHILTPHSQLMIGNGGWSYTLNRKEPINSLAVLPALTTSSTLTNDTSLQVVFDGRTPCQNFAAEHQMNVSPSCFKLKWRLTLNRDSITLKPATYIIRKVVDNIPRDVTGNWSIIKGTPSNPSAVIYQLDPDKPGETISLLAGDESVIFFLNNDNELYVGNGDFGFTLNKRKQ